MALFGSKKNTETNKKEEKSMASVALADSNTPTKSLLKGQIADILIRPRVTEKSTLLNEQANVYAFEVRMNATKPMIAGAVKNLYKVTPEKVRIVSLPAKRVFVRGKRGRTAAIKKALVYLKKGDKIELV